MMPPASLTAAFAICAVFASFWSVSAADAPASVPPSAAAGASASAPELAWPTDAGRCVTSSFCEFRPGHFHAGIDISTWGKTGYRAFAVDDGEIVRARVSCGGYGRTVYLRLEDGRTAVYAHLSRFAGALADTMRLRQEAAGSAWIDTEFAPGTFAVRRGEVVAYTGQSGVGVPHLHVEIRDEAQRPLDPLRSGLPVADTVPPRITRVALTPLGPASSVDGRSDTVIYDVLPGTGGTGTPDRLARTLPVEGEIGISVEVDETTSACRHRLAPARMELREGKRVLRTIDYAAFDFAETGLVDLQIDPRFSYGRVGRFHHLWGRPGNELPFGEDGGPSRGVLRAGRVPPKARARRGPAGAPAPSDLPDRSSIQADGVKLRTVTCVVEDAAGNRAAVDLALSFAAPPGVAVLNADRVVGVRAALDSASAGLGGAWVDTLVVDGAARAPGRAIRDVRLDLSWDGGFTWIAQTPVVPDPDLSFHARIPLRRLVPGAGGRSVVLRAQAVDALGARGIPVALGIGEAPPPPDELLEPEIVAVGSWIEARIPDSVPFGLVAGGWERWPSARGREAVDSLSVVLVRPWGDGVRIVTEAGPGGPREWPGDGGAWTGFDPWGTPRAMRFETPARVLPGAIGRTRSDDGRATITFPGDAFREAAVPRIRREPVPSPGPEEELRPLGALYALETGSVPLTGAYSLRLEAPVAADWAPPDESDSSATDPPDPGRVAVFVENDGRFRWLGGEPVVGASAWTVDTRTFLPFGLFEDAVPPSLGSPRLEERFGRAALLFRAKDEGAGLACDAVEVYFDGRPVLVELDDETGDVVAYPPLPLETDAGGAFEIRATDRCGNSVRRTDEVRFP